MAYAHYEQNYTFNNNYIYYGFQYIYIGILPNRMLSRGIGDNNF